MKHLFYTATALVLLNSLAFGQKKTEHNTYSWVSINSNIYVHKHWFIMADAHVRENGFFASSSFVFARLGLGYQADSKLSLAAGYGNLLLSPSTPGWKTKADEHRIYQQVQLSSEYKKIKLLQRLRNEQRWQQIITNDQKTGNTKFSNRVRYLLSATVPLFKNKKWPQLVIADEMLLQFGKDIVNNTFDQNRIFLGIRQSITPNLSFDAGYMNFFLQKSNGTSYVKGDVIRLFFYYAPHLKK